MEGADDGDNLRHILQNTVFVGHNVLQLKPSSDDLDVVLSGRRLPPFSKRFVGEFMRMRVNEEARVAHRDGLPGIEAIRAETDALIKGDRAHPCFLFRLPLAIRVRLWEMLFWPSDGRWIVAPRITVSGVAILQASRRINFEASIAFAQALVSWPVILIFYPDHCFLRQPFPLFANLGDRVLQKLTLPLGDSRDPNKAMKRSLDFVQLLMVLRERHPIMVYKLTIFLQKSWKLPQIRFDEDGLAQLLASGPFAFFNKITVTGVPSETDFPKLARCLRERIREKNYGRTERLRDIWGPILDLNTRIPSSGFLTSQYKIKEVREGLLLTPCEGPEHNRPQVTSPSGQ